MEKEMETHSGTLAWKIPWMEEPGGLQSMGLLSQAEILVPTLSLGKLLTISMPQFPCLQNRKNGSTPLMLPLVSSVNDNQVCKVLPQCKFTANLSYFCYLVTPI